jgi:hypothetical protein
VDDKAVSFPKGLKATMYYLAVGGELHKEEVVFYSLTIMERFSQYANVPSVCISKPKGRSRYHKHMLQDRDRFMIVIEGWGHPSVPGFPWRKRLPIHDRVNYQAFLSRFRDDIVVHSNEAGRKLIVDVHDALATPPWLTEPERCKISDVIKGLRDRYHTGEISRDELKSTVAREVFDPEEVEIMLGASAFDREITQDLAI